MEIFDGCKPLVCFFDSGIGGLNLMSECVRRLPYVDFAYFADNRNVPYGVLTKSEILKLTRNKFEEISALNPDAAVIACNTVTSRCAAELRKEFAFPIVGIQPAVKPAAAAGKCAVLATPATAESEAVKDLVKKYGRNRTEIIACPQLATYIENNIFSLSGQDIYELLPYINTDGVVLGCTHYSFVGNYIKDFYGCTVYDGIEGTARRLCDILAASNRCSQVAGKIAFIGGDEYKNKCVFESLIKS